MTATTGYGTVVSHFRESGSDRFILVRDIRPLRSPGRNCGRASMHGWCASDGMVYNKTGAERAWGELTTLYKKSLA